MLPLSLSHSPQKGDEVASVSLWKRKWAYELSHLGMVWAMGHRQGLGLGQYWDLRAAVRIQICSQAGALKRAWALGLHRAQVSHRTETGQGSHCIQELSPQKPAVSVVVPAGGATLLPVSPNSPQPFPSLESSERLHTRFPSSQAGVDWSSEQAPHDTDSGQC